MAVQTNYNYATSHNVAGGIYDMYHYPVDSRYNEEPSGVLGFGVGVVQGSIPGANVKLPTAETTAEQFEGVTVNGFSTQQDLEGYTKILNNANIGVMRKGRIWVVLAEGESVAYGDPLYLIIDGEEAGRFSTAQGIDIGGRFIGADNNGIAPAELYGTAPVGEVTHEAKIAAQNRPLLGGKPVSDLIDEDVEIRQEGITGYVTGTIKKVTEAWKEFSPSDNTGHFLPVVLPADLVGKQVKITGRTGGDREVTIDPDRMLIARLENFTNNTATIKLGDKEIMKLDWAGATKAE